MFTEKQELEICKLFEKMSARKIAEIYNCSATSVSRVLEKNNLKSSGSMKTSKTFYSNLTGYKGTKFEDLKIPDDLGNYIAGFTDGEATFGIYPSYKEDAKTFKARFQISVRRDDEEILKLIQKTLKVGSVRVSVRTPGEHNEKPKTIYEVNSLPEIYFVIVPFFEKFKLRAKKRNDFLAWSQAIRKLEVDYDEYRKGMGEAVEILKEIRNYDNYQNVRPRPRRNIKVRTKA